MSKINDNSPLASDQVSELETEVRKALGVDLTIDIEEVSGMKVTVFQVKAPDEQQAETTRTAVNRFLFTYCKKQNWPASFAVDTTVVKELAVKES